MSDIQAAPPTRHWPLARQRGGRPVLSPEQQALADELQARAAALREGSEEGLSIREAVALAAVQLGLEPPTGVER